MAQQDHPMLMSPMSAQKAFNVLNTAPKFRGIPKTTLTSDTNCQLGREVPKTTVRFDHLLERLPELSESKKAVIIAVIVCHRKKGYGLKSAKGRDIQEAESR